MVHVEDQQDHDEYDPSHYPPKNYPTPTQPPLQPEQMPRTNKSSPSAVLAQCLKLLKGDSDEHKFAGLVMVTKHVPALTAEGSPATSPVNGSQEEERQGSGVGQLRQICNAVGPAFLHRLLKTAGDSSRSSNGSAGSGISSRPQLLSVYQQIALGVLATFFQDESLVARFLPVAPALVRALRAANAVTQTQALCDALDCTQAIAGNPGGMERLLRAGAATAVVSRLSAASKDRTMIELKATKSGGGNQGRGVEKGEEETKGGHTMSSPEGLGGGGEINGNDSPAERAEAFAFAFVGRALEASGGNCLGPRELTAIAGAFRDDPTSAKFGFMDLLLRWASLQEEQGSVMLSADSGGDYLLGGDSQSAPLMGAWTRKGAFPAALREGLLQALHGAAVDKRRDSALALLASLLRAIGQEWAVEESSDEEQKEGVGSETGGNRKYSNKSRTRKRGTFVAFAVRCAAGEVRILLDEALSLLVPRATTSEEGSGESGPAGIKIQEKARGPMAPAGVDPSIGVAAEIASVSPPGNVSGDKERRDGVRQDQGVPVPSHLRAPLPAAERKAIKEKRIARLMRMVPVGLGVSESTIAFLCGSGGVDEEDGEGDEKGDDGREATDKLFGRWEELPIETLQDLQKTLVGLFGCVLDFLTEIRAWIAPGHDAVAGESAVKKADGYNAPSIVDMWKLQRLGLECSRALGVWVAEDTDSLPQRFVGALPVLLGLKASAEPPDSDDEESDDEDEEESPNTPSIAAFPGAYRYARVLASTTQTNTRCSGLESTTTRADEALHNILRAMLALSYEAVPVAAMVEEGVTARLARLAASGPPAIAVLLSAGTATGAPSGPPPDQASEAVRSPLITACSLLTNILTSAGHLAWPEKGAYRGGNQRGRGGANKNRTPQEPSHPVVAHPAMGECLVSLAEVAGLAGAARRIGGGARWRLLAAHTTLVVMIVARAASPENGLVPAHGLASRKARWDMRRSDADGDDVGGVGRATGGGDDAQGPLSVWEEMAIAVDESLGSLTTAPGRTLIGGTGEDEEASYEEGAIWQWCLECAREMEAAAGGAIENPYVANGVLPRRILMSLIEASADGRI